ncbi:MAG: hypothetical protein SFW64_02670 [Alphaproteobacteria bacterium]|nr:hypothetical protein [Alphaproteobacteria bacterium]
MLTFLFNEDSMALQPRDTVLLTTPRGHEVVAELDYDDFAVRHAKVVNHYTGVMKALDEATSETLARALKAKQVYEQAIAETRAVEDTLKRFGSVAAALGNQHPALEPYWREARQHQSIAEAMRERARHFHDDAMEAIDRLAGD